MMGILGLVLNKGCGMLVRFTHPCFLPSISFSSEWLIIVYSNKSVNTLLYLCI